MLVGNKMDEESGAREVSEKTGQALQVQPEKYLHPKYYPFNQLPFRRPCFNI